MFPLKDDIPTRRFPVLTVAIIVLNVVVYLLFEHGGWDVGQTGTRVLADYGARPCELAQGCADSGPVAWYLTVVSAMFLHGSLIHLGGNMLFLWVFGNNIEDSMGRLRFVAFYLLGGIAALALQTAIDTGSHVPTVGASGAIAAILGGYLLLYPRARVVTLVFIVIFFTILQIPAVVVLGLWFVLQLLPAFSDPVGGSGGVAYFAHIGGFVFGLVAIKLFADRVHTDYERAHSAPVY